MSTPTQSAAPSDSGYMQNQHKVFDVAQGLSVVQWPPPAVFLASVTFHWPLTHVSMLLDEECLSEVFTAAGFKWRLKFKPKGSGKQTSVDECFSSFHVENVEAAKGEKGPLASFSLGVINQDFPEQCVWRPCQHAFSKKISDWGFPRFIALKDLIDPRRGFVVNDRLIVGIRF